MIYTRSHVRALESQIADLKAMLGEANKERQDLLDRLLAKNNVQPIQAVKGQKSAAIELMHPWGATLPEIEDGLRASFVAEEKAYLIGQGYDEERAEREAEAEFRRRHEVIR